MSGWQEQARCFATLRPAGWIDPAVRDFLNGLPPGRPVLAACSGGADSVFLVLALLAWFDGDASRLAVAHFNHGLRGADADADEAFVRQMAQDLGLRCLCGRPAAPLEPAEAALRNARYAWLAEACAEAGAGAIALGQHADDLVESLLLAVFSGSGPSGMASPMPVRRFPDGSVRLRPLLRLKRDRIVTTLSSLGIPWREDATNSDPAYTRNWLRQAVVPLLRERFPQDIHAAARRTRELMEESVSAIDARLTELGLDFENPAGLQVTRLTGQPRGLVRRAILAWWLRWQAGQVLPAGILDAAVVQVAGGCAGRIGDWLQLDSAGVLRRLDAPDGRLPGWSGGCHWDWRAGPLFLPDRAVLTGRIRTWQPGETPFAAADPAGEAWLAGVEGPVFVRDWQPGDAYRPLGAPGRRKLQDLFTDARLTLARKHSLPVLHAGTGGILWVPGFPPAEGFRICQDSISALQLTYTIH